GPYLAPARPPYTEVELDFQSDINYKDNAKNLTDPDIMGFGISLYLSRVLASHVIMTMAYVTRRANPEDFTQMDSMIHKRLGAYESKISRLRGVRYEHLLLTISNQLSVTSFALLVALYSQCRIGSPIRPRLSMIALAGEEEIESLLEPKFGQILPLILLIVFIINVFDAKEEIEYTRVASTIEIPENPENSMESDVALNAATPSTTEEAIPMSETSNTTTSADSQRQPHTHITLPLPTRNAGRSNTAIRQVDGIDQEEINMTARFNLTGRQDSGLSTPNRSRTSLMESGATSISFDLQDEYEEDLKAALKMRNLRLQLAKKNSRKGTVVCVGGSVERGGDARRLFGAVGALWCVGGIVHFRFCCYHVVWFHFAGALGDTQNQGQR
ncbi:hypothetical protein CCUS01_00953, partial [Colletotrichum cuscutae]